MSLTLFNLGLEKVTRELKQVPRVEMLGDKIML